MLAVVFDLEPRNYIIEILTLSLANLSLYVKDTSPPPLKKLRGFRRFEKVAKIALGAIPPLPVAAPMDTWTGYDVGYLFASISYTFL